MQNNLARLPLCDSQWSGTKLAYLAANLLFALSLSPKKYSA